jgi:hypothetical protein
VRTKEQKLDDVTSIATSPGNYDADPYMLGMANGLILAQAIIKGHEPQYLRMPTAEASR